MKVTKIIDGSFLFVSHVRMKPNNELMLSLVVNHYLMIILYDS